MSEIKIKMDWDMFIVPNPAVLLRRDFYKYEANVNMFSRLCEANEMKFNPETDKIVQVWLCNEKCQDAANYTIRAVIDGIKYLVRMPNQDYMPEQIAKLFHEGKAVTINIPVKLTKFYSDDDSEDEIDAIMVANITARQSEYRYREYGSYEQALQMVLK